MIHATDVPTLRSSHLSEREALVAAAVLPGLPDDDALVWIHDRSQYETDETKRFKDQTPTLSGTRLRRVTVDYDVGNKAEVGLTESPHGTLTYTVNGHDFHTFEVPEDADPDFDDTDQSFLSDFDVTPSAVDAVHLGVTRTDHTFERKPVFPV
jgi:hypothetical protein